MIDIVKKLRATYQIRPDADPILEESADEIERLNKLWNACIAGYEKSTERNKELERDLKIAQGNTDAAIEDYNDSIKRIEKLEAALKEMTTCHCGLCSKIARAALKDKP